MITINLLSAHDVYIRHSQKLCEATRTTRSDATFVWLKKLEKKLFIIAANAIHHFV